MESTTDGSARRGMPTCSARRSRGGRDPWLARRSSVDPGGDDRGGAAMIEGPRKALPPNLRAQRNDRRAGHQRAVVRDEVLHTTIQSDGHAVAPSYARSPQRPGHPRRPSRESPVAHGAVGESVGIVVRTVHQETVQLRVGMAHAVVSVRGQYRVAARRDATDVPLRRSPFMATLRRLLCCVDATVTPAGSVPPDAGALRGGSWCPFPFKD
jgi:hypothetical protein